MTLSLISIIIMISNEKFRTVRKIQCPQTSIRALSTWWQQTSERQGAQHRRRGEYLGGAVGVTGLKQLCSCHVLKPDPLMPCA